MTYPLKKPKIKTRAVENLSARVYNQIKQLILCNEIMPGQKLHHQELSERLGVSRTPVREALTRLVQEGYVSFLPNRGFTCKEIRIQEAEELYDLREALEAFAVEKAIAKLTQASLDQLRKKMSSYGRDVQKRFTRERLVYDQDVHMQIIRLAGNETLTNTLSHVFERIVLKRRTDGLYDPARGLTAHEEHMRLLDAMQQRNVSAAVAIIREHIQAGKKNVMADLEQRQAIRGLRAVAVSNEE
ncbi:MAG TPA: GntR family transcriptional regulator [Candidatus Saccharimonadales bacterium]|jgi:GntR family transcriptional regulator, rspAB operon transcriptional repressor|nr:GntR family transcriptional regulator [Candidatus Saccharimonadales bacterium]